MSAYLFLLSLRIIRNRAIHIPTRNVIIEVFTTSCLIITSIVGRLLPAKISIPVVTPAAKLRQLTLTVNLVSKMNFTLRYRTGFLNLIAPVDPDRVDRAR